MKRPLSEEQQDKLVELVIALGNSSSVVRFMTEVYNGKLRQAQKLLVESITRYNADAAALRGFYDDRADAADTYISDRSDRWQESEIGLKYEDWAAGLRRIAEAVNADPALADLDENSFPRYGGFLTGTLGDPKLFDSEKFGRTRPHASEGGENNRRINHRITDPD